MIRGVAAFTLAIFGLAATAQAERILRCEGGLSSTLVEFRQTDDGRFFINKEDAEVLLTKNDGKHIVAYRRWSMFPDQEGAGIEIVSVNFEKSSFEAKYFGVSATPIYGSNCRRTD